MSRSARPFAKLPAAVVRTFLLCFLALTLIPPAAAQVSFFDPRLEEIRSASVAWDRRTGPERKVVDVVCLVPDVATFLDVIAVWDEHHYFPILIDDVEYTFKFLRAFRPARIVRAPKRREPAAVGSRWDEAIVAVGKSWAGEGVTPEELPRGNFTPKSLGTVPPGVVISSPDSPALAGAVALAAGRFQPLFRWETQKHFDDPLGLVESRALGLALETLIADRIPKYDQLGDDCDFVTLAGDYPYRYEENGQHNAFDDLILRAARGQKRWAFAGRLTGNAVASVYRAMCSLFLAPSSAVLFNTYSETETPWSEYSLAAPASRLGQVFPTTHKAGDGADLASWHQTLGPVNPHGLLLVNTSGEPSYFSIRNGPGQTGDIPATSPAAVLMIHSFSAVAPGDPETIAGRWLANGAFVFFGAMNEPFLHAFRPPVLVGAFLGENLPLVTAVRRSPPEFFGQPWRLVYFGDPLYRIKPAATASPRLAAWSPLEGWPAYGEFLEPEPDSADSVRLSWVLKTKIFRLQTAVKPQQPQVDPATVLLGIARRQLDPKLKSLHDDLLVDTMLDSNRVPELLERLGQVPSEERSSTLKRHLETCQLAVLERAIDARDPQLASTLWKAAVQVRGSRDFLKCFTVRVGRLADNPERLNEWRARLTAARKEAAEPANAAIIDAELKSVAERLEQSRGKGQ
jgi:hypothetical protein